VDELLLVLGERIRELRKERDYSQEGFADACGVHRTYMGALERGEVNVSFKTLMLVSRTLGIALSDLFAGLEKRAEVLARKSSQGKRK
jgi:transcriptional regulator with XRE-family HTH domain